MDHTAAVLTNIESGNASQAQELSSKFIEAIEVRSLFDTDAPAQQPRQFLSSLTTTSLLFCSIGISDTSTTSSEQATCSNTLRIRYLCSQIRSSGSRMWKNFKI